MFVALFVGLCALMTTIGKLGQFPTITLPSEKLIELPGGLYVSNTLLTTFIVDVVIVLFAVAATRRIRKGSPEANVPRGSQNIFELLIDMLYGLSKNVAGSNALRIFPLMATIFLFVLFANWVELVPGNESIGQISAPHEAAVQGFKPVALIPGLLYTVDRSQPVAQATGEQAAGPCTSCVIVPFIRTPTTDINTTLALALIAMFMVQVFGVRALGGRYFFKFVNIPALRTGPMGYMLFVVGFLELISEISRILSFTFRLLGNIFAGGVLLFVMTSLIPFFVPVPFYGLELFVGFIQALVFAMLTLVFVNMAMQSHDGGHEEAHH
jgi:F-type H+-transporting ATPase subunit a